MSGQPFYHHTAPGNQGHSAGALPPLPPRPGPSNDSPGSGYIPHNQPYHHVQAPQSYGYPPPGNPPPAHYYPPPQQAGYPPPPSYPPPPGAAQYHAQPPSPQHLHYQVSSPPDQPLPQPHANSYPSSAQGGYHSHAASYPSPPQGSYQPYRPPSYPPPPPSAMPQSPYSPDSYSAPPPVPPAGTRPVPSPPAGPPSGHDHPSIHTQALASPHHGTTPTLPHDTVYPPSPANQPLPPDAPPRQPATFEASDADPLRGISSQFGRMGLRDPGLPNVDDDEPVGTLPSVRENGQPNAVIWECPQQERIIDYKCSWYHLDGVADFLACTRCYEQYLEGTSISGAFRKVEKDKAFCRFNVPRLTKCLVPEAKRTNDVEPVRKFMIHRLAIPDCKGTAGAGHEDNVKWFVPLTPQPTGFVACEACYEDQVSATPLASHFRPSDPGQQTGETWACDFCLPVVKRAYGKLSKTRNGWDEWLGLVSTRMSLPQCTGQDVDAASCEWFRPRRRIDGMVICSTCYHDKAMYTPFANEFEKENVGAFYRGQEQQNMQWSCDLGGLVSMGCAWDTAIMLKDFGVFWRAASKIMASSRCSAEGIQGSASKWHTLTGGCHDFDICDGCHAGILEPLGLSRFFQPVAAARTSSTTLVCDLNPAAPRFVPYMFSLAQALDMGVWQQFSMFVRKWAGIPGCQGRKLVENHCWYGYGDMMACPECYMSFAEQTRLGRTVPIKNVRMPQSRMCSLYSKRMRTKWLEACEKNDPTELIEYSRYRMEIYKGTVLRIDYMRAMQLLQVKKAAHDQLMGTMYQCIENTAIQGGTGAVDGYWHGPGRHLTRFGATSDAFKQQGNAGMSQAINSGTAMQIMQLEMEWSQVE